MFLSLQLRLDSSIYQDLHQLHTAYSIQQFIARASTHARDELTMHIHPSSPIFGGQSSISSEDIAATKIQAGFRGYRVRKQLKQNCSGINNGIIVGGQSQCHSNNAGQSRYKSANKALDGAQPRFKSANKALDNGQPPFGDQRGDQRRDQKEKCATKIQAGIRGFLVRKKQRVAADAAVKIQAGFRGFRARKQLKNLKE